MIKNKKEGREWITHECLRCLLMKWRRRVVSCTETTLCTLASQSCFCSLVIGTSLAYRESKGISTFPTLLSSLSFFIPFAWCLVSLKMNCWHRRTKRQSIALSMTIEAGVSDDRERQEHVILDEARVFFLSKTSSIHGYHHPFFRFLVFLVSLSVCGLHDDSVSWRQGCQTGRHWVRHRLVHMATHWETLLFIILSSNFLIMPFTHADHHLCRDSEKKTRKRHHLRWTDEESHEERERHWNENHFADTLDASPVSLICHSFLFLCLIILGMKFPLMMLLLLSSLLVQWFDDVPMMLTLQVPSSSANDFDSPFVFQFLLSLTSLQRMSRLSKSYHDSHYVHDVIYLEAMIVVAVSEKDVSELRD